MGSPLLDDAAEEPQVSSPGKIGTDSELGLSIRVKRGVCRSKSPPKRVATGLGKENKIAMEEAVYIHVRFPAFRRSLRQLDV